jgi:hypothetical protein
MTRVALAAGLAVGACGLLLAVQTSVAQTAAAPAAHSSLLAESSFAMPRTPEGRPDFQGVVWTADFFGMLEAIPMMLPPELVVSEEKGKQAFDRMLTMFLNNPMMKEELKHNAEAAALITNTRGFPIVRGERRTRLVALPPDGKVPYTPEARREAAAAMTTVMAMKADNPEDRMATERCTVLGAGPPIVMDFSPRQFFQTRDHIVILSEYGDDVRIVPFVRGAVPAGAPGGNAAARWDGDTLVIETTGLPRSRRLQLSFPVALIINPEAKVIERFTRVSREELLYQFTVEDPTVYTAP